MSPQLIDSLSALAGVTIFGGFIIATLRLRLKSLQIKLSAQNQPAADEVQRLTDTVDHLNRKVQALSEECAELNERLDFTERMLSAGK